MRRARDGGSTQPAAVSNWGIGVTLRGRHQLRRRAPDGETTRFLALGRDQRGTGAGGRGLADAALWCGSPGRVRPRPGYELRAAVPAHFGVNEVRDVTIGLYQEKISIAALHGLVPVLFELAGRGDQVARDLVLRMADEILHHGHGRGPAAGPDGRAGAVVLGGSLMTARDPLLSGAIASRLAGELLRATIRIVDVPPVAGAALLGPGPRWRRRRGGRAPAPVLPPRRRNERGSRAG